MYCSELKRDILSDICSICSHSNCSYHPVQIKKKNEELKSQELKRKGLVYCNYRKKEIDKDYCDLCNQISCKNNPEAIKKQKQREDEYRKQASYEEEMRNNGYELDYLGHWRKK